MLSDSNIRRIGRILGLEKSVLAKKVFGKYQKLKFRNYHGIVEKEIQGSRMLLDLDDPTASMNLFFYGVQSSAITSCFYNEIKTGMTVFDIGANIGCYTMLAAKLCGPSGKVFGFEPSKTSCDLIEKSLNLNSYSNVKLISKGVSNQTKKGKLFINPRTSTDNRIIESSENRKSIEVEIVSLDDFIKEEKIQPDFIKIDVQGTEFYVIEGMKELLESSIPLKLIIEFSPLKDHKRKSQFDSCLKKMKELGFSIFRLKEVNDISNLKSNNFYISKIKNSIKNIKETGISKFDETDLLFIRD